MEARFNPTLALQVTDILAGPARPELACERALVVAARMLDGAAEHAMTATTVVGVIGRDDVDEFRSLVQDIAEEFGLDAEIRLKTGSFSVRLSRLSAGGEVSS
jgi:poly(3-hydroxybutyrate) depolymerase